jgi:hypothetical protein
MKIAICSSTQFLNEVKEIANELMEMGHEIIYPHTIGKVIRGEADFESVMNEKNNGLWHERGIKHDSLRSYYQEIKDSDAILVTNFEKKGIKGYIGGAVLLEMGFAHVLNKKIFVLNEIPEMPYTDEMKMMQPVVINGDLNNIK